MAREQYRYAFPPPVSLDEVESTLLLAVWGAESLHGETQVRLEAPHRLDRDRRTCVIDVGTAAGRDVNRLFAGYLRREFAADAFRVERVAVDAGRPQPVGEGRA
jgi:hypothetical protein